MGSWLSWSWAGIPDGAGFSSPPPSNKLGTAGDGAIMFIGEGPGHKEYKSKQFSLNKLLKVIP